MQYRISTDDLQSAAPREPGVATTKAQIQKGALTSDEVDPALLVERLDQEVVSAVKAAVDKAGLLQRTRF
ncbi:hypothetical protein RWK44_21005 [Rhizobium sp. 25PS6]|uniref:hypothetical protein n=1 Tax=Rhizobium TaxID=379 RepID=UPI00103F416E|nr:MULTISPECIES: hypothetical protein [Rhizobium]MBY3225357.1 hypothetical protein [Rhizobium laguerreae]MBY3237751.1 hypothetical protein [Rhizobium laguerreae]MDU0310676.1 hypothetical protein [Rhizobium sp. 10PS4]MDU0362875.1 hypothetical protein [Rhizobium sp. 25PS6]TBY06908.1 hypothetical protein E0J21_16560 [Rhizobium laguerreae]